MSDVFNKQPEVYLNRPRAIPFVVNDLDSSNPKLSPHASYYQVERQFFNGFQHPVTVVERSGFKVEIPGSMRRGQHDFIVRYTVTVGEQVKSDTSVLWSSDVPSDKVLAEVIDTGGLRFQGNARVYTLDYHVKLDDIRAGADNLYLTNLDIVVSLMEGPAVAFHPYSDVGLRNAAVEEDDHVNRVDSFGYKIRIYDSRGHFGDRFVNIGGQVYKVPAIRNASLPDGVEVVSSGKAKGDYLYNRPERIVYSFADAEEKLRLFRTVGEAETHGDEALAFMDELKRRDAELKAMDQDRKFHEQQRAEAYEQRKRRIESEDTERQAQQKLIDDVRERQKKREDEAYRQTKHVTDMRALQRKETSEVVRWLPAFVTGLFALFTAFARWKPA